MGADITFKQTINGETNDLEFNKIKGSHDVKMHRRSRKYYRTYPGVLIRLEDKMDWPSVYSDTDLSHYHDSIVIPETVPHKGTTYTVRYLDEEVMRRAINLYEISIPGTVREIPKYAFCNCYRLTKAVLHEGTELIDFMAFCGCYDLREANIPNSVQKVEKAAYFHCKNLTRVTLGSGLKSLGDQAFDDCRFIETVTCYALTPPTAHVAADRDLGVFDKDAFRNAVLKVPQSSLDKYKNHNFWKQFKKIEAI